MSTWMRVTLTTMAVAVVAVLFAAPTQAQRTGDHIVPSIETVCDGDPYNFGLCNAYCEALDCESPTPLGTPRACSNLLRNYKKKSGGALPPCACPCGFNVQADFDFLVATFETEEEVIVDLDETYQQACAVVDLDPDPPLEEDTFVFLAEAFEVVGEFVTPQGVRLFYWLTPAEGGDPATCNREGGGLDDVLDPFFDWSYGPYIENPVEPIELTEGEFEACENVLEFLCSANN